MKIVMNNFGQTTPDGATVTITSSVSDPVSSCSLSIVDNTSSTQITGMPEILVLDDKMIPNPTANLALNPTMNPYNSYWNPVTATGITASQNTGGGTIYTASNAANGTQAYTDIVVPATVGQSYTFSCTVTGNNAVNFVSNPAISFFDNANNQIVLLQGPTVSTSNNPQRVSYTATAPTGTVFATAGMILTATMNTNSGSITFTNAQMEAQWFSSISYPTPFCGPNQTNCTQIQFGLWIRQYRKFAGFVTQAVYDNYHGNVRTIQIHAVSYAWLMGTVISNKTYTNQYDSAIISDLLNTYFTATTPVYGNKAMFTTTNVVQGVQLNSLQINWDDLRTVFNNLAAQTAFYWTIDYYWNFTYAPLAYITMAISLICDSSSTPDNITTFPAYDFRAEMDFTQPGTNIYVFGNGSNTAQVIDPAQASSITLASWFTLSPTTGWARKINESNLNSTNDVVQRGIAELLQYDYVRFVYHLTTNVELIAGQAIPVTSSTDNLNKTALLIQQVKAIWLGTNETFTDVWEYQADLGAVNRQVSHILSRLFRSTNSNTSAPAINNTTLVVFEKLGVVDTASGSTTLATSYQATILGDNPIAYYRLDELLGTIADDFSGNAYAGTLHGTVTLGTAGLLHSGSDTAMTFDGSTGYISLPTSLVPTGAHAWSLECWVKFASIPANGYHTMVGMGQGATHQQGVLTLLVSSGVGNFVLGTFGGDITNPSAISAGTIYHLVGTYDGTNTRLYTNGSLVAGPSAFTLNLTQTFARIGQDNGNFCPGIIDEVAIYNYKLSSTQINNHYTAGTT